LARQDDRSQGAIAQLGERVLCKHEVVGSIPSGSTRFEARSPQRRHSDERYKFEDRGFARGLYGSA
jgi:hypothetical protein